MRSRALGSQQRSMNGSPQTSRAEQGQGFLIVGSVKGGYTGCDASQIFPFIGN